MTGLSYEKVPYQLRFGFNLQAGMQLQDRNMHKQLLAMRSSIHGLKDELKSERERWQMEMIQQDERTDEKPSPGYVTQVEITRNINSRDEPGVNHIKQDSGILTDEERSDDDHELGQSVSEMMETFPPAVRPRSSSFSATVKRSNRYHIRAVKLEENADTESNDRKASVVFRVRAQSVAAIGNEKLSNLLTSPRRSQTFSDGVVNRFGSMPVINEIPGDAFERNTFRSKTFAVYGYRRPQTVDDMASQSPSSAPKRLPAFGPLTRHGSMPVMYSGGRPKSGIEFRSWNSKTNAWLFNNNQPIKRSTSQIVLSRPAFEKEKESYEIQPYRIYRSASQISLV